MENRGRLLPALLLSAALFGATAHALDSGSTRPSDGCRLDQVQHGRRLTGRIEVGGVQRDYILDVPDSVLPHQPAALLLDFHGFGHSGAGVWNVSGFRDLATHAGFITIYPEGLPVRLTINGEEREAPGWEMYTIDGNRDLAFVHALLDDLERRYCVDRLRVFATGFSNGAFFSSLLGCTASDRIAAVAPVSGGPLRVACAPGRGVPILIQHGRQDPLIPVDWARTARDAWLKADQCVAEKTEVDGASCERWSTCRPGATVEYCEEDYGHTWPPPATERVWKFLQQHPMQAQ